MPGTLVDIVSDVVAKLIVDLGLGNIPTSVTWPVFSCIEPESPDSCITVYGTEGVLQGRSGVDKEMAVQDGIQIRVRSSSITNAKAKAEEIAIAFDGIYQRAVSLTSPSRSYAIQSILRTSPVIPLGRQAGISERYIFTVNATLSIRQTA